jgi:hypothetical protein
MGAARIIFRGGGYGDVFAESRGMLLGYGTINGDATMDTSRRATLPMEVPLGTTFSMRSAPITTSRDRRNVGSSVFCWIRPEAVTRGPTGQVKWWLAWRRVRIPPP